MKNDITETYTPLTARERKVMDLICEGLSNDEIIEKLCISMTTLRTYIARINSKMYLSGTKEKPATSGYTRLRAAMKYKNLELEKIKRYHEALDELILMLKDFNEKAEEMLFKLQKEI